MFVCCSGSKVTLDNSIVQQIAKEISVNDDMVAKMKKQAAL